MDGFYRHNGSEERFNCSFSSNNKEPWDEGRYHGNFVAHFSRPRKMIIIPPCSFITALLYTLKCTWRWGGSACYYHVWDFIQKLHAEKILMMMIWNRRRARFGCKLLDLFYNEFNTCGWGTVLIISSAEDYFSTSWYDWLLCFTKYEIISK